MTQRERVYAALRFEETDVIPYIVNLEPGVARCARILGHGGGYIMTTAKPIRPEVPTENAAACVEAIIEEAHRSPSV
jgi:hypothetical protein